MQTETRSVPLKVKEGSREKLLEVAIELFAQKGLEGVSTRDLARAAGVNISLISYYFGGKEGLYVTAIREFAEKAGQELEKLMSDYDTRDLKKENFVAFMVGMVERMVLFKRQSPRMSELMMREVIEGLPHARPIYETQCDQMAGKVIEIMEEAQRKKILRADVNPHTLFFSLVHSVDCYFLAVRCDTPFSRKAYRFPEETPQFCTQLIRIFIEGVLL